MKKKLRAFLIFAVISNLTFSQAWISKNVDPNTGIEAYEIDSGDIDGDGDIDIVMATYDFNGGVPNQDYIRCYLNDGTGNFPIQIIVSSTITYVDGLILADVNEDGAMDIVATSVNQNKLVYYLSSTSMDNSYSYTEVSVDSDIGGAGQVVAGDINGDNHIDLVAASFATSSTRWYSGDGSGNFMAEPDIENGTTDGSYYADLADFDDDGDLDVLVGYAASQTIEIFYNQFDNTDPDPASTVSWIKDTETVDSGISFLLSLGFADVNNDGVMDVVKLDNSSGKVEWFNKVKNGTSTPNTISDASIIRRPGSFAVTDIDEDGLNDVIVTDGGVSDDAIIWFKGVSNATPETTPSLIVNNNFISYDITTADFDGDLDIDIASVGNITGRVDWIENRLNTLGIDDVQLNSFNIYPNPAKDVLNFKGFNAASIEVTIFDVLGKNVLNKSLKTNETLNVSQLVSGLYTIRINETLTSKFIKE